VGAARTALRTVTSTRSEATARPPVLLALDWTGGQSELLVGRHHGCDVVLPSLAVSRRHARLVFRDGNWVLQDLDSTNGTTVNGVRVGRCEVRPGDLVELGDARLQID
jgi:pilus assembly protein CpaF